MNFNSYQNEAKKTAVYPNVGKNFIYPTLGLAGESGECVEKIKHILRDKGGRIGEAEKADLKDALGDVLWYIAQLSTELGFKMEEAAQTNLKKIFSRQKSGTLKGDHK